MRVGETFHLFLTLLPRCERLFKVLAPGLTRTAQPDMRYVRYVSTAVRNWIWIEDLALSRGIGKLAKAVKL